jgi:hypothetical protein
MWNDTMPRIREYTAFHLNHEYYNMEFLGRNYFDAPSPRAYMPVMILGTVPAVTLALFGVGAVSRVRAAWSRLAAWMSTKPASDAPESAAPNAIASTPSDRSEADLLWALAFCAALGPWLLPKTPIFGGTKHWMPAYPFLALFAARGFEIAWCALQARLDERKIAETKQSLAQVGLVMAVLAAPLAITIHSHPFGLSSYTPLVGGAAGAADLGLNRQFWGFTTQNANVWLAPNAPRSATVFIHDTAWDSWQRMIDEKRVRPDLRGAGSPSDAQIALVQHELHMSEVDFQIWMAFGTDAPAYVVTHDGVPIVSVYQRPQ